MFVNADTSESLPSVKVEYASGHGDVTFGTTLNAGDGWAGLGAVVRF